MCGIAGALHVPGAVLDAVPAALTAIAHRGPDDSGWIDTEQGRIGMTRLAVMDPANGQQPMGRDGVQLVFNGEIYNFKELRTGLEHAGHTFHTTSDTEVLLAMYLEHGPAMLDHLVGMFAFAIVDGRTGTVLIARDRFGKKPIYHARSGSGLVFASEIKALRPLLDAAGHMLTVRDQGVYDFLSLGVVPQPDTVYEGVVTLEPGSYLVADRDGIRTHRWWRPEFATHDVPVAEARERVRELMADSVRLRLRSDVPLGVFLSGGVDSSVIAYEATQVLGDTVHAFTVATGSGLDESAVAGRTADALGIRSTVLPLEFDPLESLRTVVSHYDQPFADSSAIPSLALSRLARQHVTVVLNGDGGDEVFGGYRRHVAAHLAGRLSGVPDRLLGLAEKGLAGRGSADRRGAAGFAQRIMRGLQMDPEDRYLAWSSDMLLDRDKRDIWLGGAVEDTRLRVARTRRDGLGALDQQLATDIDLNLLSDLLVKMDMATMAYSLEGRSPFLDHRVAEYVWSLPAHVRLPRARPKGLLRDSYRGLLSDEVITGKKKGFEVPVARWLAEDWRELLHDVLLTPSARVTSYVDATAVEELVRGTRWPEKNTTYLVYALLVLELWLREQER
jgi:asparagine synthase (glutamine-hydrolysing)